MRRGLVYALVAVALGGGLVWWFLETFEYVDDPPVAVERGPARYNRYYLLERALRRGGHSASSVASLAANAPLPARGTLVIGRDLDAFDPALEIRLQDWVGKNGGHLVLLAPRPGAKVTPLLAWALGLRAGAPLYAKDCPAPVAVRGKTRTNDCFARWLALNFDEAVHDAERGWIGRVAHGNGHVTLTGWPLLDNRALRESARDDLVWWALAPGLGAEAGPVVLVYAYDAESLPELVLRHGWMAVVAALAALAAFLWSQAPRFGPLLPSPRRDRRELLEHVLAGARLAWRHRDVAALNEALKRQVMARAAMPLEDLDEAAFTELAKRAGLPVETVRLALRRDAPREERAFIAHIDSLTRLRRSL